MQEEKSKNLTTTDDYLISDEEAERVVEADEKFETENRGFIEKVRERYQDSIRNSTSSDIAEARITGISEVEDDSVTVDFEVRNEKHSVTFCEDESPSISDLFEVTDCGSFSELYGEKVTTLLSTDGEPLIKKAVSGYEKRPIRYITGLQIWLSKLDLLRRAEEDYPHPRTSGGELVLSWKGVTSVLSLSLLFIAGIPTVSLFSMKAFLLLGMFSVFLWLPLIVFSAGQAYEVLFRGD